MCQLGMSSPPQSGQPALYLPFQAPWPRHASPKLRAPAGLGQRKAQSVNGRSRMLLVTGGAGFIGSNVVAALNEAGRTDVVVNDVLGTDEKWRNLGQAAGRGRGPPADLFRWLDGRKLDAVIHMGAISDTTATDADLVIENNFRTSLRAARLVHRGAGAVHLRLVGRDLRRRRAGFNDDWSPQALQELKPLNLYGWSKHLFDLALVDRFVKKEKLPPQWAGLKFFNVFGPNEYHKGEMMSLVAKRFDDAKAGRTVRLFKSHRPGIARRRPAARFHLCRRRGRGGALADGDAAGVRHLQRRHRHRRAASAT